MLICKYKNPFCLPCHYLYIGNSDVVNASTYNLLNREEYKTDQMNIINELKNRTWIICKNCLKHIKRHRRIKNYKISYWNIEKLSKCPF